MQQNLPNKTHTHTTSSLQDKLDSSKLLVQLYSYHLFKQKLFWISIYNYACSNKSLSNDACTQFLHLSDVTYIKQHLHMSNPKTCL